MPFEQLFWQSCVRGARMANIHEVVTLHRWFLLQNNPQIYMFPKYIWPKECHIRDYGTLRHLDCQPGDCPLNDMPWGLEEGGLLNSRLARENSLQGWLLGETWRTPYLKESSGPLRDTVQRVPSPTWSVSGTPQMRGLQQSGGARWERSPGRGGQQSRRHRGGTEHSLSGGAGYQSSPIWEFIHRSNRTQADKVWGQTLGFAQEKMSLFPELTVCKQKDIKGPVEL